MVGAKHGGIFLLSLDAIDIPFGITEELKRLDIEVVSCIKYLVIILLF